MSVEGVETEYQGRGRGRSAWGPRGLGRLGFREEGERASGSALTEAVWDPEEVKPGWTGTEKGQPEGGWSKDRHPLLSTSCVLAGAPGAWGVRRDQAQGRHQVDSLLPSAAPHSPSPSPKSSLRAGCAYSRRRLLHRCIQQTLTSSGSVPRRHGALQGPHVVV